MKAIKIVQIIDSSHVIINVGDNDGIKEGQMFRIIGKESKKRSLIRTQKKGIRISSKY